jgi:DNA polymerase-4
MEKYAEVSAKAFEIFEKFTPYVEAVSIDEAFLDITGSIHLYGSAKNLAEELQAEINKSCGVTCSIGVAPNRLLAKIGSEENKPNGLTVMPFEKEEIKNFLKNKQVSVLWGVGKKTAEILKSFSVVTCGDIQKLDIVALERILGSATGAQSLYDAAHGISDNIVIWQETEEKSVSREHTFDKDEPCREVVREKLLELLSETTYRFRQQERRAKTVRVKLRTADFVSTTKQSSFDIPVKDNHSFREKALQLFNELWPPNEPLRHGRTAARLIGFGIANIQHGDYTVQTDLFGSNTAENRNKQERLSAALDKLKDMGLMP